mgnify:FL=1|tara:strand:+ start:771 stop:1031 length:261 start_codon:yes stop_codon:yes gene_type:complete
MKTYDFHPVLDPETRTSVPQLSSAFAHIALEPGATLRVIAAMEDLNLEGGKSTTLELMCLAIEAMRAPAYPLAVYGLYHLGQAIVT